MLQIKIRDRIRQKIKTGIKELIEKNEQMKNRLRKNRLFYETVKVLIGSRLLSKYKKQAGRHGKIIFMRGATGDIYIQFLLLDEYLKQHEARDFLIVCDAWCIHELAEIFCCSQYLYCPTHHAVCMEKAYLFFGGDDPGILMPLMWTKQIHAFNGCRVRLLDKFHFMDIYVYLSFALNHVSTFRRPAFRKLDENVRFQFEREGMVKGRTIIVSPDANSVTGLPVWFWNGIIAELQQKGYVVFMNCRYPGYYRAKDYCCSYLVSVTLLEFAGYFLGVRSGFCDIISTAACKKVILYPKMQKKKTYNTHRAEKEYSSLAIMGLAKADENLCEISTPLIRNILDKDYMLGGTDDYFAAMERLRKEILENF